MERVFFEPPAGAQTGAEKLTHKTFPADGYFPFSGSIFLYFRGIFQYIAAGLPERPGSRFSVWETGICGYRVTDLKPMPGNEAVSVR